MVTNTQQQQIIKAFAEWGAKKYGKGQMTPEQFLQQVQQLDEQQQKALLQEFQQEMQQGQMTVAARLGAKLNYIKQIKGDCPEGEELVYFKKGGRFCKACRKKQEGGNVDEIANFKKNREEKKCGGKMKEACGGKMKEACGGKMKKECGGKMKNACGGKMKEECGGKMEQKCGGKMKKKK